MTLLSTHLVRAGRNRTAYIRESWQRCAARSQSVDDIAVPQSDIGPESRALARAADPVMRMLEATLVDEPVAVVVANGGGLVVLRFGSDPSVLKALDAVALTPGSTYAEEAVGTNGIGLTLTTGQVSLVRGAEHYRTALRGYTCAAAPLFAPGHAEVLGAVSLTTWSERRTDLLAALVAQTAMNVGAQLTAPFQGSTAGDQSRRPPLLGPGQRLGRLSRIEELERSAVTDALSRHGGSVNDAAADLGLSRSTVYRRIKTYGIAAGQESHS